MHPIERLRYVARSSGVPQATLVQETAQALGRFVDDPRGLVTACQRVVSRQPSSGALVWFAARVLTANDPVSEVWEAAGGLQADPTAAALARGLPDGATVCVLGWPAEIAEALQRRGDLRVLAVDPGEGTSQLHRRRGAGCEPVDVPVQGLGAAVRAADLVLLEAAAIGPETFVAVPGSLAAAAVARCTRVPVWLVGGVGRVLPSRMYEGLEARLTTGEPWDAADEIVPNDLVDQIVGIAGPEPVAEGLKRCNCPVAPELFGGIAL